MPSQSERQSTGDRALEQRYSVAEFVAYLTRIGYHEAARRVSADRQVIVIPEPEPRYSKSTIRRWRAYEDHRIRTEFVENLARMGMPEAERIRDEARAAMEDPDWLPEHAREAFDDA